MSLRNAVLFEDGKPSLVLRLQTAQKGALQPIAQGAVMVEQDRSASRYMRLWWAKAFPNREPLPFGPVATEDGRGSDAFWDVFE
jgi:hypothetical protein